jgi:glutamate-1-semialdehyde aminotransferase
MPQSGAVSRPAATPARAAGVAGRVPAPAAVAAGATFTRLGSIFWLVAQIGAPTAFAAVDAAAIRRYGPLHARLLAAGVYLAPSGWEVAFLSHAMNETDVDRLGVSLAAALAAGRAG